MPTIEGKTKLPVRYFAQGARTNGLVGSSLVAFLSCFVFFGVMALFYRVSHLV
jgi:hypothetical protein